MDTRKINPEKLDELGLFYLSREVSGVGAGPARLGPFRQEYERNRKKVLATQSLCGICGKPVDKTLHWMKPDGPTVDHIIPIAKGGHPSDIDNLQLAHRRCNQAKSDKLTKQASTEEVSNRNLPWTVNWRIPNAWKSK